jgi:hypothetical protein
MNSCSEQKQKTISKEIHNKTVDYEIHIPKNQTHLLILFPCFPCDAENTKSEFDIVKEANSKGIGVILMNYNQHLWLSENEKLDLKKNLEGVVNKYKLNTDHTFIGGFSSGGTVSLLLSNYLKQTKSIIQPEGVFIADSPIDLLGLYDDAVKDISSNFSPEAVSEATWIVETFEKEFGKGDTSLIHYKEKSPYLLSRHSIHSFKDMKNVKIRLYTEPDSLWWKENRQVEYKEMNAYFIKHLAFDLQKHFGEKNIEYIPTKNKGYRANGYRHPHSWSIIDKQELLAWILK